MRFGRFTLQDASDVVLAHSINVGTACFSKGRILRSVDIDVLSKAGRESVIGARLEGDDVLEDLAAARISGASAPGHTYTSVASTGRVNVYANTDGLFFADRAQVNRLNGIDPAITFACLQDRSSIRRGDMVATFKIIPFGVAMASVEEARELLSSTTVYSVAPYRAHGVALLATTLPHLKASVMDKTSRNLAARLVSSGSWIETEERVPHDADSLAKGIRRGVAAAKCPMVIVVFGASAVVDINDVIPSAIRKAGGEVTRVGMPVDPGNLLVLGWVDGVPVIGAPGCARSSKENGFDWILNLILCGRQPSFVEISEMGVGGLLKEIPTRPRPREGDKAAIEPAISRHPKRSYLTHDMDEEVKMVWW